MNTIARLKDGMADGWKFRFSPKYNDDAPYRIYLNGKWPYVYAQSFKKGQTAIIRGRVDGDFEINFMGGRPLIVDNKGQDVLHIKNEFGFSKYTTINTCKNGQWLDAFVSHTPLTNGRNYEITVTALEDKFEIRFNRRKFVDWSYRLPLDYIEYINILGETTLQHVYIRGQNFPMPYRARFPDGDTKSLQIGNRVVLVGVPYVDNEPFVINFYNVKGSYWSASDDITMQFKVNFSAKSVERNARFGGEWGKSEKFGPFPFEADVEYEIVIVFVPFGLMFYVNDIFLVTFNHRTSSPSLDYKEIEVKGAIKLRNIIVCNY